MKAITGYFIILDKEINLKTASFLLFVLNKTFLSNVLVKRGVVVDDYS